ncbi:MAG: hypothetical protein WBF88_17575 [Pusillimonas sp.]
MQLDRLTIILPWIDSRLMPNNKNGKAWQSTNNVKIRAKQDGHYSTQAALGRNALTQADRYPLRITFVAPDGRHRDLDNMLAASKAALDGVADALGIDDKHFRPITIDAARDTQKRGFVKVEIGI